LAKRIAEERGIDLRTLKGSGPDGRIVKRDVESPGSVAATQTQPRAIPTPSPASAAQSSAPPAKQVASPRDGDIVVTPTKMRQAIARRMSQSKREAPHYYLLVDADMTRAMEVREEINAELGDRAKVSINDLIVKACAIALQRHPVFNATIDGDAVTERAAQHVCIAIAMDEGLIAPAILDAGTKSLVEISLASRDLVDRAKNGALQAREVTDGTFTITNLGAYGIETLIGIIQPPQTAILGVGSVMEQAFARDGVVSARRIMKLALSADHRVTDGAQGAVFLGEIKRLLERPAALLL
jgi:pyruvate dehydrogenase E2 component (dihydrolipoamide acetyltransferase)